MAAKIFTLRSRCSNHLSLPVRFRPQLHAADVILRWDPRPQTHLRLTGNAVSKESGATTR